MVDLDAEPPGPAAPAATATGALQVRGHRIFPLIRLGEKMASTFWLVPVLFLIAAVVLTLITRAIDRGLAATAGPSLFVWSGESAAAALSVMAVAMLSFLGVVFTITLVAMQLASQQFSPRLLRTYVRSTITKVALGTFIAAFVYPLLSFSYVHRTGAASAGAPTASGTVSTLMTILAIVVFVIYVNHTINLMRISIAIKSVAQETRRAVRRAFPPASAYLHVAPPTFGRPQRVVAFRKPAWSLAATRCAHGVLQGVDATQLVHLARRHDCVLRALVSVGDYVSDGQPVVEVCPRLGDAPPSAPSDQQILRSFDVGPERTLYQDPAYGLRELVDVAVQALSPAVNAPTTAVQVVDRLEDILRQIVTLPEPTGLVADDRGDVRLALRTWSWDDVLVLALTEIRRFGAGSPQVSRRLAALLDGVQTVAPAERQPAIERHRQMLKTAVVSAVPNESDQQTGLTPDRRGLG
jgi:uncharacterized membrane protein